VPFTTGTALNSDRYCSHFRTETR